MVSTQDCRIQGCANRELHDKVSSRSQMEPNNSWSDGLALYSGRIRLTYSSCALIDRYRPDLLQYNTLQRHNHRRNFELAFDAAEKIEIAVLSRYIFPTYDSLSSISKMFVMFALMNAPS